MIRTELSWLTRENSLGPVLLDGGTGSLLLERIGGDVCCPPLYNLSHPEMVVSAHREFIAAGSMVIATNSFCAAEPYLSQAGYLSDVAEVNTSAVRLARQAIIESGVKGVMIAGSVAPLPSGLTEDERRRLFGAQIGVLVETGVEILLCETFLDAQKGLTAVEVAREVSRSARTRLPVVLSMVPPKDGRIPEAWGAIADALADGTISAFGLNCGTGLEVLRRCLEQLDIERFGPFWVKPSAGLPVTMDGKQNYPVGPKQFAEEIATIVKRFPVVAAGGCCGAGPEHIDCLKRELVSNRNESSCTNGPIQSS